MDVSGLTGKMFLASGGGMVTPRCPHYTPGLGADRTPPPGDRSGANCSAHRSISRQGSARERPGGDAADHLLGPGP